MDVMMVLVEAPGPEYAAAWTCTMSKTGEIITGNAAAAPLSVQNKKTLLQRKAIICESKRIGEKKQKIPKNEQITP